MENSKEFIKRTTYVVDKKFQFRFVAIFLVVIIVSLVIFSAGVVAFYWVRYMTGDNVFSEFITISKQVPELDAAGNTIKDSSGNIVMTTKTFPPGNRLEVVVPPILVNNLIIMIIISIIGVLYSHRIAGPVYRMEKEIGRVLDGEKGVRVTLRKKDKLKNLAEKLNALIEKLEKK
jgi:methyl-accepting chemotaxis protein